MLANLHLRHESIYNSFLASPKIVIGGQTQIFGLDETGSLRILIEFLVQRQEDYKASSIGINRTDVTRTLVANRKLALVIRFQNSKFTRPTTCIASRFMSIGVEHSVEIQMDTSLMYPRLQQMTVKPNEISCSRIGLYLCLH